MGLECRLKEILESRGIKQKWLCEKTGLSSSAMSQIVRGESFPTLHTAIKIAKAIGIPVEEIWIEK
jgi:transcriptional regulator with XRE-family HTH domain